MTEQDVGPIDYLAVEFPQAKLTGEGLGILVDLVDQGIIRILDLRFVKREQDGSFTAASVADFDGDGLLDLAVFEGVNQASSMTTIYGRPSNSSSRATPLGWLCTRTRGRARSSQPCGERRRGDRQRTHPRRRSAGRAGCD